ncbi:MAG: cation:proton antiporter [Thermoleophilia bacterium]
MIENATWLGLLVLFGTAAGALFFAKLIERWGVPEVLAYLVVGIVLGPQVLGVLSSELLARSFFLPQLILGFVAFMLGELLTPRALLQRRTLPIATVVLSVLLPFAAVTAGAYLLAAAPMRQAVTLGILAMAGAPATVLALRQSLGDHSPRGELLAALAAMDNLLVVFIYGTLAPFLMVSVVFEWSVLSAVWEVFLTVGVGAILGLVGTWLLRFLRGAKNDVGQAMAAAALVVGLLVASSEILGASSLIACAVAGIGTAIREQRGNGPSAAFEALHGLERIVYVFFFIFAGTEIVFGHVFSAGVLAIVYILGRSLAKILAALVGGLTSRRSLRESLAFGTALLPQAGVVVGLALDASARFPEVGAEVLAVVMAALVVFELVGPIAVQRALKSVPAEPSST